MDKHSKPVNGIACTQDPLIDNLAEMEGVLLLMHTLQTPFLSFPFE